MLLFLRSSSSGDGVDADLCKRFVNCLLRLASRSFWTDSRSRRRRGLVGGVGGGESVVVIELFTSEAIPGVSVVLPPLQQRLSEGGGVGGAVPKNSIFSSISSFPSLQSGILKSSLASCSFQNCILSIFLHASVLVVGNHEILKGRGRKQVRLAIGCAVHGIRKHSISSTQRRQNALHRGHRQKCANLAKH